MFSAERVVGSGGSRNGAGLGGLGVDKGQGDPETGALPRGTLHGDVAPILADQIFHDGQSQAAARNRIGPEAPFPGIGVIELF